MAGRKSFLAKPKHQFMYPNVENMIAVPIPKTMDIITSIQVCHISWITINYKENGERKAFLQIQSINIVYPNLGNMIVVPITTRMEDIVSIQVCLI